MNPAQLAETIAAQAADKKAFDVVELDVRGVLPRRVEGLREARWILRDYLDVVVHIFTPEARDFYRLEQLWGEVPATARPASSG